MKTVADVMSRDPITVPPGMTVQELATLFMDQHIGMAPVVDENGDLLGVVTETDLIEQDRTLHIPTVIALMDSVFYVGSARTFEKELQRITARTVGDICTRRVKTVKPETPLDEVADLMVSHKYTGIPVVVGKKVVGVVSRIDLIRSMVAPAEGAGK